MTASDTAENTFLFADLAGFTALTEAMGDEEAAEVAASFSETTRALLTDHGATEVKTIGDALMLRVGEAEPAIALGLAVVHEVGGQHGFPIVRVGMDTGPAVQRGADWFGATVNTAARVSGLARGGEVLLTEATRVGAGETDGIELHERGRHELRNVAEPVLLFAAFRAGAKSETGLPIDPVCRMAVDPERAAGTLVYDGGEYHFCSLDCVRAFVAGPERFVADAERSAR